MANTEAVTKIKPAELEESAAIVQLVERSYAKYVPRIGRRPSPMDDDYDARISAGEVFVAVDASSIVGVIVLRLAPTYLLVENVAVEPDRQGQGVGRFLLAFAEQIAQQHRRSELRLYTNQAMTENIAFYRRLGWEETGRYTEQGFARVYFCKRLVSNRANRDSA